MYRLAAVIEVETEDVQQVETVRRKMQQAMKTTFDGAPYKVRGVVSPAELVVPDGRTVDV